METVIQKIKDRSFLELLESREQLKRAILERDAFIGFHEQPITFEPTYRVTVGTCEPDGKRVPSWTDRVLYKGDGITGLAYTNNKNAVASDHLPVIAKFSVKAPVAPKPQWDVVFEHLPTWFSSVPLVGRFQINQQFYKEYGSYRDWIGVFPASIDDCTSASHWIYGATCFEQVIEEEKFMVCEFTDVPVGTYRLGYFAVHLNCLVGLSKTFQITDQPNSQR
uniref:SKICH domain-containing protein n=1 Tax=Caenorhabditis japonica TaxID=281687 RepID=A0A8R1IEM6_CAEJA